MNYGYERFNNKNLVRLYWDSQPCNIKHSKSKIGSLDYFNEVEQKSILSSLTYLNLLTLKNMREKMFSKLDVGLEQMQLILQGLGQVTLV
jgi:hypothetical protein